MQREGEDVILLFTLYNCIWSDFYNVHEFMYYLHDQKINKSCILLELGVEATSWLMNSKVYIVCYMRGKSFTNTRVSGPMNGV